MGNNSEQASFVPDEAAVVDGGGERHKEHSKYETTRKMPPEPTGAQTEKRRKSSETDHSGEQEQIHYTEQRYRIENPKKTDTLEL